MFVFALYNLYTDIKCKRKQKITPDPGAAGCSSGVWLKLGVDGMRGSLSGHILLTKLHEHHRRLGAGGLALRGEGGAVAGAGDDVGAAGPLHGGDSPLAQVGDVGVRSGGYAAQGNATMSGTATTSTMAMRYVTLQGFGRPKSEMHLKKCCKNAVIRILSTPMSGGMSWFNPSQFAGIITFSST